MAAVGSLGVRIISNTLPGSFSSSVVLSQPSGSAKVEATRRALWEIVKSVNEAAEARGKPTIPVPDSSLIFSDLESTAVRVIATAGKALSEGASMVSDVANSLPSTSIISNEASTTDVPVFSTLPSGLGDVAQEAIASDAAGVFPGISWSSSLQQLAGEVFAQAQPVAKSMESTASQITKLFGLNYSGSTCSEGENPINSEIVTLAVVTLILGPFVEGVSGGSERERKTMAMVPVGLMTRVVCWSGIGMAAVATAAGMTAVATVSIGAACTSVAANLLGRAVKTYLSKG